MVISHCASSLALGFGEYLDGRPTVVKQRAIVFSQDPAHVKESTIGLGLPDSSPPDEFLVVSVQ